MKKACVLAMAMIFLHALGVASQETSRINRAEYKPAPAEAPSEAGALTATDLSEIASSMEMTGPLKAAQNTLSRNKVSDVVVNQARRLQVDDLFTHVIKDSGSVTNQKNSGRCWLFAGLNILRPAVIKKYKMENFELSQAYNQFWDKLERANRTLELAMALIDQPVDSRKNEILLKRPIDDGGDWNYVVKLVDKYGVVPSEIMPDTYSASHTSEMNSLLETLVRKGIMNIRNAGQEGADTAQLREIKKETLKKVYKVLVLCLGNPPAKFEWRYEGKLDDEDKGQDKEQDTKVTDWKEYTPQSFYTDFVGVKLSDYVALVNYAGLPMHSKIEWAWNRDTAEGPNMSAVNITAEEMGALAMKSVMQDEALWFACNASIQGDRKGGLWVENIKDYSDLFQLDFSMSKAARLAYWNGAPNHAMALVGVDVRNGIPVKWKVENSWGSDAGNKGYYTITKDWFDLHVYELIVNKKFVSEDLLKLQDQEALVMPPWDPFS